MFKDEFYAPRVYKEVKDDLFDHQEGYDLGR